MLLDPPGWPGEPHGLPHWPYVQAVDEALTVRGIPPGTVRVNHTHRERGLSTYMVLAWDVSRTGGQGGIRLHWEERRGWFYALLGLGSRDVLLHTVLSPIETIYARPEDLAGVAEELVRHRRLPDARFRGEWDGAKAAREAARDFRRTFFGLRPAGSRMGSQITEGEGVQLTIDTKTDTYEQAIAAVQAAYGVNPAAVASGWPEVPALEPRPGPETLSSEDLWEGWTDRLLFDTVAAVMPGARAVLRRLVELGGTASYDEVREHFIDHPESPILQGKIGGVLTSVRAVRRRIGPDNRTKVLELDERARVYRIEPALLEGLKRAFDLAEIRPDLLRQDPAADGAAP